MFPKRPARRRRPSLRLRRGKRQDEQQFVFHFGHYLLMLVVLIQVVQVVLLLLLLLQIVELYIVDKNYYLICLFEYQLNNVNEKHVDKQI